MQVEISKANMKYDIILFDIDDTLLDYGQAEAHAFTSSCRDYAITLAGSDYVARYRSINQQLWHDYEQGKVTLAELREERFRRLFAENNPHIAADEFSTCYLNYLGEGSFLIEGAVELCSSLQGHCRMAVITNGIREVQLSRIGKAGLNEFFEHIIVSEETGYQKPHKGIFDYAFAKLGVTDPSKIIIIGDSLTSDMQGGMNSGIDTCWFNPHRKSNTTAVKPAFEIQRLSELLSIING